MVSIKLTSNDNVTSIPEGQGSIVLPERCGGDYAKGQWNQTNNNNNDKNLSSPSKCANRVQKGEARVGNTSARSETVEASRRPDVCNLPCAG
jgi:hypothetical protein